MTIRLATRVLKGVLLRLRFDEDFHAHPVSRLMQLPAPLPRYKAFFGAWTLGTTAQSWGIDYGHAGIDPDAWPK